MLTNRKLIICAMCLCVLLLSPVAFAGINPADYDLRDYAPFSVKQKTFAVEKKWSNDGTKIFEYYKINPGELRVNNTIAYSQIPVYYHSGEKIESTNGSYLYYDSAYILELPNYMMYDSHSSIRRPAPTRDKFVLKGSTGKITDFNGVDSGIEDVHVDVYTQIGWVKDCIKIGVKNNGKKYSIYLAKGVGLVYIEGDNKEKLVSLQKINYR